jgi:hypothetical protein
MKEPAKEEITGIEPFKKSNKTESKKPEPKKTEAADDWGIEGALATKPKTEKASAARSLNLPPELRGSRAELAMLKNTSAEYVMYRSPQLIELNVSKANLSVLYRARQFEAKLSAAEKTQLLNPANRAAFLAGQNQDMAVIGGKNYSTRDLQAFYQSLDIKNNYAAELNQIYDGEAVRLAMDRLSADSFIYLKHVQDSGIENMPVRLMAQSDLVRVKDRLAELRKQGAAVILPDQLLSTQAELKILEAKNTREVFYRSKQTLNFCRPRPAEKIFKCRRSRSDSLSNLRFNRGCYDRP